jgi:hypothetical protein
MKNVPVGHVFEKCPEFKPRGKNEGCDLKTVTKW